MKYFFLLTLGILFLSGWSHAQEDGVGVGSVEEVTVDADLGESREGSRTGKAYLWEGIGFEKKKL